MENTVRDMIFVCCIAVIFVVAPAVLYITMRCMGEDRSEAVGSVLCWIPYWILSALFVTVLQLPRWMESGFTLFR